jgi:hypothetical protein
VAEADAPTTQPLVAEADAAAAPATQPVAAEALEGYVEEVGSEVAVAPATQPTTAPASTVTELPTDEVEGNVPAAEFQSK